jgi:hypothetical protein
MVHVTGHLFATNPWQGVFRGGSATTLPVGGCGYRHSIEKFSTLRMLLSADSSSFYLVDAGAETTFI